MSEIKIVSQSAHPLGGHFLALRPDGQWLAGKDEARARPFDSAQAVVDAFHPLALAGAHWAWNICYAVEDACAEEGAG